MEDQSNRIPEKEFLLIHTHLVQTNKNRIELHDHQDTWICKGYLLSIDTTIFHRPRLRIHHDVWDPHIGGAEDDNAVLSTPVHSCMGRYIATFSGTILGWSGVVGVEGVEGPGG